jgi:hypothetical protein
MSRRCRGVHSQTDPPAALYPLPRSAPEMAASQPAPAAAQLSGHDAALAQLATDATRALLGESTPAERLADKNTELERLDSVVVDAQGMMKAHLQASKARNDEAKARGEAGEATRAQTMADHGRTGVLTKSLKEAKAARAKFAKATPGAPDFLAAALDAVREYIAEEEEEELTPQQRAIVLEAVQREVNKYAGKPVSYGTLRSLPCWGLRADFEGLSPRGGYTPTNGMKYMSLTLYSGTCVFVCGGARRHQFIRGRGGITRCSNSEFREQPIVRPQEQRAVGHLQGEAGHSVPVLATSSATLCDSARQSARHPPTQLSRLPEVSGTTDRGWRK